MRGFFVILGLGVGLMSAFVAGCGKSAPPNAGNVDVAADAAPGAAAAGKACDVLTPADATTALGREVTKLDATGGAAGLDICQFGYEGEKLMDTGNVSVTVMPVDLASLRAGVEAEKGTIEEIAGIGDAAFYTPEFGLYVGKGNRTAIYLLGAGGMTDARERSIALAKATVGRL